MKLRTSNYEYYFRSKTHSHLLSSQKTAFRLAQLEERACAEWEAGDVTAQWCDHVDWDKVSSPLAYSHEFFFKGSANSLSDYPWLHLAVSLVSLILVH